LQDFGGSFCLCVGSDFISLWRKIFIAGAIKIQQQRLLGVLNKILDVCCSDGYVIQHLFELLLSNLKQEDLY